MSTPTLAISEMYAEDAARYLGVARSTLSHWKREGRLRSSRTIGNRSVYDFHDLNEAVNNDNDLLITPEEAAEICPDISATTIRRLARNGEILYCYQVGSRWMISRNGLIKAGRLPIPPAATPADPPGQTALGIAREETDTPQGDRDRPHESLRSLLREKADLTKLLTERTNELANVTADRNRLHESLHRLRGENEDLTKRLTDRAREIGQLREILSALSRAGTEDVAALNDLLSPGRR